MAVWGIGASWDGRDVSKEFVGYKTASIGYDEENKSTYHKMIRESVKIGDLIFIKAKHNENGKMRIKAIGVVIDNNLCKDNGFEGQDGIKVYYIKNLTDNPIVIDSPPEYGSTHTLYKEEKATVVQQIVNLL